MESLKNKKKTKKEVSESEEEEEIEEVEEEFEEEEEVEEEELGEDFSKDPRAFTYLCDAGKIADGKHIFKIRMPNIHSQLNQTRHSYL
jgi:glutamate formiminotransferase